MTPAVRQRAGIGRYARGLLGGLAELDQRDHYTLVAAARGADLGPVMALPFHHRRVLPLPVDDRVATIAWHRLRLPLPMTTLTGRLDVFLALDFALPPLGREVPGVVVVYDLAFLTVPDCADPGLRAYLTRTVPRAVARAARVVAISRSTRDDLVRLMGVPADRITVAYPGVDPVFTQPPRDDGAALRARLGLPARFVLAVGTIEPRKNLARLVEAVAALRGRPAFHDVELVIAGRRGWLDEPVFARVREVGLEGQVHFVDLPNDDVTRALYHAASVMAFPSLYEGFGIPPVEALACGTPVVCSNTSSLPEAVGDAALLVDPLDVDGLAGALARVLEDEALRADLRARGRHQAATFTWRATAEAVLGALHAAAGR
ncbi:MAG: glycosyltransferase family 1 protein [Chloroflexota bacterium]